MLTKKIAELVETAQGGNGILTQTGGYLHDYAGKMGEAHAITNKQVEELWALVEADETAGKSNSEMMTAWFRNWVNMAYRLRKQRRSLSNMERKPECQVHLLKK